MVWHSSATARRALISKWPLASKWASLSALEAHAVQQSLPGPVSGRPAVSIGTFHTHAPAPSAAGKEAEYALHWLKLHDASTTPRGREEGE